jgi:dinuclear metal center YbgI/SA1388 family protein
MKLSEIIRLLESNFPLYLQESWDNSGLLLGNPGNEINKVLVTLDVTEEVVKEAISKDSELIISHHPVIFNGIKSITGKNATERIVETSIRNKISIYAIHTNLDNSFAGINAILCNKLGLNNIRILVPKGDILRKLVTFCPVSDAEKVRTALFNAGAGHIGNYDSCSFNAAGTGTFRGSEDSNPYVGERGKLHYENEIRIETIYPVYLESDVLGALHAAHPYEEVAYDLYNLGNEYLRAGTGMVGELSREISEPDFLNLLKKTFGSTIIRHSKLIGKKAGRIAVCGGSGSFLINDAIKAGADFLVTSDVKYHNFFETDGEIVIADIGHYESEQFAKELIYNILIKNFSTFAVLISELNTNSVNYL